jgi:hypothetical protein
VVQRKVNFLTIPTHRFKSTRLHLCKH